MLFEWKSSQKELKKRKQEMVKAGFELGTLREKQAR